MSMNRNTKDIIIKSLTGVSVLLILFVIVSMLADHLYRRMEDILPGNF